MSEEALGSLFQPGSAPCGGLDVSSLASGGLHALVASTEPGSGTTSSR